MGDGLKSIMEDASGRAVAPQVTVCSSEAALLIWIKPQLVLERPTFVARGGLGIGAAGLVGHMPYEIDVAAQVAP
jgi:hypothetical protein